MRFIISEEWTFGSPLIVPPVSLDASIGDASKAT